MATPVCPSCHGRGGMRGPNGWIKCSTCKPRQTKPQAREAALNRLEECARAYAMFGERKLPNLQAAWESARGAGATVTACSARIIAVLSFSEASAVADKLEPSQTEPTQLSMEVSP